MISPRLPFARTRSAQLLIAALAGLASTGVGADTLGPVVPVDPTEGTTGYASSPRIGCAADGRCLVVWTDYDASLRASNHGQWLDATGQRSGPRLTFSTSATGGFVYPPKLAVAPDGHFVVAYATAPVQRNVIQWFEADGQARTPPRRLNGGGFVPSVAMDPDGDTVAAYQSQSPGCSVGYLPTSCVHSVHVARYAPDGALRTGRTVRSVLRTPWGGRRISPGDHLAVAMDPAGDFLVAWREEDYTAGVTIRLMARAYSGNGDAKGRTFEIASSESVGTDQIDVAAGAAGHYVATWSNDGKAWVRAVHGRRPQGAAIPLVHPDFERAYAGAVAGNAGDAFVALVSQEHFDPDLQLGTTRLYTVRLDASAAPVGPQSALGGGDYASGRIALDPQGNATAVWDELLVQHPRETRLLGQRVEP